MLTAPRCLQHPLQCLPCPSFGHAACEQLAPTCQKVLQPILLAPRKHVLPKEGVPQDVRNGQPRQRLPNLPLLGRLLVRPFCNQPCRLQIACALCEAYGAACAGGEARQPVA